MFQMVDGHTLFDYSVGLNEIVQIMIRPPDTLHNDKEAIPEKSDFSTDASSSGDESNNSNKENEVSCD